jgi:hypothetical protein
VNIFIKSLTIITLLMFVSIGNALELKKLSLGEMISSKVIKPIKEDGYLKAVPIGVGLELVTLLPNATNLNRGKLTGLGDITAVHGSLYSMLMNINKEISVGLLLGSFYEKSEKKVASDYLSFIVKGNVTMLLAKYKYLVAEKYILDIDLGLGEFYGGYQSNKTDETSNSVDIVRNQSKISGLIGLSARYRINPFVHIGLALGYFKANLGGLNRAGSVDSGSAIDFSGQYISLKTGINF